jgi:hypothetical protein
MEYAVKCVLAIELKTARPAAPAPDTGALRGHVDEAMRELEHRWVAESHVELDLARSEASFTVIVDAGDQERAMSKAWGVLSMAVHAAGGATSHRPFPADADWSVRLVRAKASLSEQDTNVVFA